MDTAKYDLPESQRRFAAELDLVFAKSDSVCASYRSTTTQSPRIRTSQLRNSLCPGWESNPHSLAGKGF